MKARMDWLGQHLGEFSNLRKVHCLLWLLLLYLSKVRAWMKARMDW